MKNLRAYFLGALGAVATVGCIDETYFGESAQANITAFTIEGAMETKIEPLVDWNDVGTIEIAVPMSFNLDSLKVTNAECSQLAHFDTDPMTLINFSSPVTLWVTAEKQTIRKKWVVTVTRQQVESIQLPFSKFNQWTQAYAPNALVPMQIGDVIGYWPGDGKAESPWQSSIEGNVQGKQYGVTEFSVLPVPQPTTAQSKADYARLQTVFAGNLAASIMGTGMASGGLFTGEFVFELGFISSPGNAQPRKMIKAGVPFYSKPKAVRFDMRYKGGARMVDGKLNPIASPAQDSCDILFALQNRLSTPNQWIRVATAALRTPKMGHFTDDTGFERYEMPFVYGAPSAADLVAKPYQQIGGSRGELTFYTFTKGDKKWVPSTNPIQEVYATDPAQTDVDHILVMTSSSAYGDLFKAAIGSTLDIKNIELIYE